MVEPNSEEVDRIVQQIEEKFAHELSTVRELLSMQNMIPEIGTTVV